MIYLLLITLANYNRIGWPTRTRRTKGKNGRGRRRVNRKRRINYSRESPDSQEYPESRDTTASPDCQESRANRAMANRDCPGCQDQKERPAIRDSPEPRDKR
jgi:hypothetical protein